MRRLPLAVLACVVLAGLLVARGCTGRIEKHLPRIATHVLSEPDSLELVALWPHALEHRPEPGGPGPDPAKFPPPGSAAGELFHGFPVLGRASVEDPAERARLTERVGRGVLEAGERGEEGEPCFRPRHGLRARRGERTVELVISYECRALELHIDGQHVARVPTDGAPAAELSVQFRRHGLDVPDRGAKGGDGGDGG